MIEPINLGHDLRLIYYIRKITIFRLPDLFMFSID